MAWSNQEDFNKDLFMFSDNASSPNVEPEPLPVTIAQWKARNGNTREESIYDTVPYENDVIIISSGRGRGRPSELYRPGAPFVCRGTSEEDEIRRRLQEVNSQAYSNVNIEATIRMQSATPKVDEFCDAEKTNWNNTVALKNNTSSSCPSPVVAEEVEEKPPLLPLSQMRQNARQKPRQKLETQKLYSQALKNGNSVDSKH